MHESQLHTEKCFITLTYDDDHMPEGKTLVKSHFQSFMKRLRKHAEPQQLRFFHCGEYGSLDQRPHYHALIYGYCFNDRKVHSRNAQGNTLYVSETLQRLWPFGFSTIGELTYETAAYTARYIVKKVTGEAAQAHYQSIDINTGEVVRRLPEYVTMSNRPGIGRKWYDKYKSDAFPSDFLVVKGKKIPVPKYYTRLLRVESEATYEQIKRMRLKRASKNKANNTPERLLVREEVKNSKIKSLKRNL